MHYQSAVLKTIYFFIILYLSPFHSQNAAFHFTYKNRQCFQYIQFRKAEYSINMLCKILASFILPCLVISFKADIKPALKGNPCLFVYFVSFHTLEMSCLCWTGSSQIFFRKYQMKKSIIPALSQNFNEIKGTLYQLKPQIWSKVMSISKITFYANLRGSSIDTELR